MKANPIKVLLFEDNPGDIRLLQEYLRVDKNDPYELIIEGNLHKGLMRLPKEKPDVILLDLGLPDSQGMNTFSKVHSLVADVPIVILTGLADTEIAVEAVKAGAQDYLVKGEVNDSLLRRSLRYAIQRKRGEEQLRESEESFHSLVENAPIGIYRTTPDGRITMVNPALLRVLGYKSFDELAQRDLSKEGFEPEYPRHDFQELLKKKGELIGLESAWKRKDGSTIFVRESARLVQDENHRPQYYEGTVEDITERKQAEETLALRNDEIRARNLELNRLYQATGSLLSGAPYNLKGLATTIVDTVLKELGYANCSLIMSMKDSNNLLRLATVGPYTDQVKDKKLSREGTGIVPQVISTGTLMNVGDVHAIPGFIPHWEEAQSELTVPLKIENKVIGVIDIQSSKKGAFSAGDERLMSIFAERAALALERGRLNEELEEHVHQLTVLRTIDMAISSSMDIHLTLDILLENLIKNLGVDAADVLVYAPMSQTFHFSSGRGFHSQALQRTDLRLGDGYAGQAALSRKIVSIMDLHQTTGGLQRSLEFHKEGFISYMGVPLIAKGQIKGVLEVFQRDPVQLNPEQVAFLEMLAGQAAIAIDSNQLFENLQRSNSDLTMAYDETIEGWSRAVDLRDQETEGHSKRVTETTLRMANMMSFKPEELLFIQRGALLHDIGKLGIPDSILLKPGPLTDEEWVIMRKHPQLAHDMLKPILYLSKAIDIPWCHHEKWDGTGYPRGLKREDIPLAARIFSVVDVWDALLSDRPYRKGWSVDKARTYIQEQAGMYFDPQIVEIFLRQISNINN
jgi:PAS domain S-box-containing protein